MKKGFGRFFGILGLLNIFRGGMMANAEMTTACWIMFWGVVFTILGFWIINTSKPKEKN